jgi:serine/threonine-protein kinase HipA
MRCCAAAGDSTIENALSQAAAFGLRRAQAQALVREVARTVDGWKDHFRAAGVTPADIEMLAQYIDGGHLGGQRAAALGGG